MKLKQLQDLWASAKRIGPEILSRLTIQERRFLSVFTLITALAVLGKGIFS